MEMKELMQERKLIIIFEASLVTREACWFSCERAKPSWGARVYLVTRVVTRSTVLPQLLPRISSAMLIPSMTSSLQL